MPLQRTSFRHRIALQLMRGFLLCPLLMRAESALEVAPATPVHTFSELIQVQAQVQKMLPRAREALVAVQVGPGAARDPEGAAASGVIISPDGLILLAAHVVDKPGRQLRVVLADGSIATATSLGMDTTTDAAMAKLNKKNDKPWPHVPICRDAQRTLPGEWCFALGHPGGQDAQRGPVLRVGKIIRQAANNLQTDCVLMGGDSGGPLFNLQGEVIGIHSLIWEERDQNVHIAMAPFLRSWDAMLASQVIKEWDSGAGGFLGVVIMEGYPLEVLDVFDDSPAQKADLRAGDRILSLNDVPMTLEAQFRAAIRALPSGETVILQLLRDGQRRKVNVVLGSKPTES